MSSTVDKAGNSVVATCSVCLDALDAAHGSACPHAFHAACCPLCRPPPANTPAATGHKRQMSTAAAMLVGAHCALALVSLYALLFWWTGVRIGSYMLADAKVAAVYMLVMPAGMIWVSLLIDWLILDLQIVDVGALFLFMSALGVLTVPLITFSFWQTVAFSYRVQ